MLIKGSIISAITSINNISNRIKSFVGDSKKYKIGELVIPCVTKIVTRFENQITEHTTEDKTCISDNILIKPTSITIEGFISDVELKIFGLISLPLQKNNIEDLKKSLKSFLPFQENINNSQKAYEYLKKIRNQKELVSIVTNYETYKNFAISTIEISKTPELQTGLSFTAELKEVRFSKIEKLQSISKQNGKLEVGITKPIQDESVYKTNSNITNYSNSVSSFVGNSDFYNDDILKYFRF